MSPNRKVKRGKKDIEDAVFEDCVFDTKDAFWHAKNITVQNSVAISENDVIAAGVVVTKDIPANLVVGGVPAKIIKYIMEDG